MRPPHRGPGGAAGGGGVRGDKWSAGGPAQRPAPQRDKNSEKDPSWDGGGHLRSKTLCLIRTATRLWHRHRRPREPADPAAPPRPQSGPRAGGGGPPEGERQSGRCWPWRGEEGKGPRTDLTGGRAAQHRSTEGAPGTWGRPGPLSAHASCASASPRFFPVCPLPRRPFPTVTSPNAAPPAPVPGARGPST